MFSDNDTNYIINSVQHNIMSHGMNINANQVSPFIIGYRPELDTSRELDADNINYFQ